MAFKESWNDFFTDPSSIRINKNKIILEEHPKLKIFYKKEYKKYFMEINSEILWPSENNSFKSIKDMLIKYINISNHIQNMHFLDQNNKENSFTNFESSGCGLFCKSIDVETEGNLINCKNYNNLDNISNQNKILEEIIKLDNKTLILKYSRPHHPITMNRNFLAGDHISSFFGFPLMGDNNHYNEWHMPMDGISLNINLISSKYSVLYPKNIKYKFHYSIKLRHSSKEDYSSNRVKEILRINNELKNILKEDKLVYAQPNTPINI